MAYDNVCVPHTFWCAVRGISTRDTARNSLGQRPHLLKRGLGVLTSAGSGAATAAGATRLSAPPSSVVRRLATGGLPAPLQAAESCMLWSASNASALPAAASRLYGEHGEAETLYGASASVRSCTKRGGGGKVDETRLAPAPAAGAVAYGAAARKDLPKAHAPSTTCAKHRVLLPLLRVHAPLSLNAPTHPAGLSRVSPAGAWRLAATSSGRATRTATARPLRARRRCWMQPRRMVASSTKKTHTPKEALGREISRT